MLGTSNRAAVADDTTHVEKLKAFGQSTLDKLTYTRGIDIAGQDLDTLTDAGFYQGRSGSNSPEAGFYYLTLERYPDDNNFVHQTLTTFGAGGNTANKVWTRCRVGGSWGAWEQLVKANTAGLASVFNLSISNYAAIDFANDTAAAAGGVVLGQVYHNAGALRIRIV